MKLIIFDLGNTLVQYKDIPLNWSEHYSKALNYAADKIGININKAELTLSKDVLNFYNTRINPREFEVPEGTVISTISNILKCDPITLEKHFFNYFQRKTYIEEDVASTLKQLKDSGIKTAVFTDVPYSMPKKFAIKDLEPLLNNIDTVVTSCDIGYRKPNINCLKNIYKDMKISLNDIYYIGDEIKDIECGNRNGINTVQIKNNNRNIPGSNFVINKLSELTDII